MSTIETKKSNSVCPVGCEPTDLTCLLYQDLTKVPVPSRPYSVKPKVKRGTINAKTGTVLNDRSKARLGITEDMDIVTTMVAMPVATHNTLTTWCNKVMGVSIDEALAVVAAQWVEDNLAQMEQETAGLTIGGVETKEDAQKALKAAAAKMARLMAQFGLTEEDLK